MLIAVGIYAIFSIFRSRNKPRGIPNGLKPAFSTGDGDCLYNSVSIAVTGDEDQSLLLRLAAVLHAVEHFDHYLQMVCRLLLTACFTRTCVLNKA